MIEMNDGWMSITTQYLIVDQGVLNLFINHMTFCDWLLEQNVNQ